MEGLKSPRLLEKLRVSSKSAGSRSIVCARAASRTSVMQFSASFVSESDSTISFTLLWVRQLMAQKGAFHNNLRHWIFRIPLLTSQEIRAEEKSRSPAWVVS